MIVFVTGATAGFGFRLALDTSAGARLYVTEAFENGPALAAGIDRGAEIVAIGTTAVAPRLFAAVNAVSAISWGIIFCSIGYWFGHAFEALVGRLTQGPRLWWLVGGIVAAGLAAALIYRQRSRAR